MKRAVILHGTDGSPEVNWIPWLKKLLVSNGVEVFVPKLPDNHTPNRFTYEEFLKQADWDFSDNIVIGHSSGATTTLSLLQSEWFPHIDSAILVGTFLNEKWTKTVDWYEPGQFDMLFPEKFDIETIKSRADHFYFLHGNDDPYCDIEDARKLNQQLAGKFTEVEGGHHLGSTRQSLTEIIPVLKERGVL